MNIIKNYKSSLYLIACMCIGAFVGVQFTGLVPYLRPIADTFVNLLYCLIVPLIFVSTVAAISKMTNLTKLGRMLVYMFALFILTGVAAGIYMSAFVGIFDPSKGVTLAMNEVVDTTNASNNFLAMFTTDDFYLLFSRRNLMALVVFTLGFGVALSSLHEKCKPLIELFKNLEDVIMKLISYVMKLAPLGIGCLFAGLAHDYGSEIVGPLSRSIIIYLVAAVIYYFVSNSIFAFIGGGKEGFVRLWKSILPPTLTALGTCSSAATIPTTMIACKESGIPDEVSSLCVPLGTNLQKDGAVLIQILKISFMCSMYGMNFLEPSILIKAILVSVLASCVMGAIPSGGYVGELFIVAVFGFPPESIPIMVLIGTVTDAPATAINATAKVGLSMMLSRKMYGLSWLNHRTEN